MRCFLVIVEVILVGVFVPSAALVPKDSRNLGHRRGLSWAVGAWIGFSTALLPVAAEETTTWQLGNGEVQINAPLRFGNKQIQLTEPRLLGSGGGGAVFSMRQQQHHNREMALKISWIRSAASVENECRVLQELETFQVPGVEKCFGTAPYPLDARRVMILLEPVVESTAVASVTQVSSEGQAQAVRQIVRTMVQMLNARVVMTDVQPLILPATGQFLLIDLTEAHKVANIPLSFLDVALARSFCTEMLTLIPETYQPLAAHVLLTELQAVTLPNEFYQILRDQTIVSSEVVAFIDSIIGAD
jgi:hypothetical protein